MRVGLVVARANDLALLRQTALEAGVDVAWVVETLDAAKRHAGTVPCIVATVQAANDPLALRALADSGASMLLATEADADIHLVYDAVGPSIEAVPMQSTALVSALARCRRARVGHAGGSPTCAPTLVIAASAGGPEAIATVLRALPRELPVRIIIAQHLDAEFCQGLATWLATNTPRVVEVAKDGDALTTGRALLVASDRQARVDAEAVVRYGPLDREIPFQPCIDTLLTSLASTPRLRGVAALLTGMGADGANGLRALRDAGWRTIAQDANGARARGMPEAAARLGAATSIVSLAHIGSTAASWLSTAPQERP